MLERLDPALTVKTVPPPDGQQSLCPKLAGNLAGENAHTLRRAVEPVFISPIVPHLTLYHGRGKVHGLDRGGSDNCDYPWKQCDVGAESWRILGLSDVGRQLLQILRVTALADYVSVIG